MTQRDGSRVHGGASERAVAGGLEALLLFPQSGNSKNLEKIEDELWKQLADLECREKEAEEQAAQGRPFIG